MVGPPNNEKNKFLAPPLNVKALKWQNMKYGNVKKG